MKNGSHPSPVSPLASVEADDTLDISEYIDTLYDARWLIAGVTAVSIVVALAYAVLATPIYRSDVLVQIEEKAANGGLAELTSMFTGETPAETEIEILRSRSLVGGVVEQLGLDIEVEPRRFPLFGSAIARRHKGQAVRPPLLGLSWYGWGGERIQVQKLVVPDALEDEELILQAGEGGTFKLLDPDDELLVEGRVGEDVSRDGTSIFVAELVANPGTEFEVKKHVRNERVKKLQKELRVVEKGKKTGILHLSLEGKDRRLTARTLDAIATAYLRQNVDRKSEEAEKTLEFLNAQLPDLKAQLQAAEAALNEYRSAKGTVNLTLEAQAALNQIVEVEKKLSELNVQRADLRQRFTGTHPVLASMERQNLELQTAKAQLDEKLKSLPKAELETARLMRDVRVADELYLLLLNKAQELRIVKSGTIGNVRILDTAVMSKKPEWPRKGVMAAAGLVLGAFLGGMIALGRKSLTRGVEDPETIERVSGISVYANILHSTEQAEFERAARRDARTQVPILASADGADIVVESIRSLRTSLQFALAEAKTNIVSIGGPSPSIGKSFISVNLAYVMAETGKRVLVVDGDMRRGKMQRYFGVERAPGLSEVIIGSADLAAAVRKTSNPTLFFLPSGAIPPNPSELLLSDRAQELYRTLSAQYDLVVIDTPPILAVTDAAIVGRFAGVNLVVLRAGQHPAREIYLAVRSLAQNGAKPNGIVLNDIHQHKGIRGRSRYAYHYHYDYKSPPRR